MSTRPSHAAKFRSLCAFGRMVPGHILAGPVELNSAEPPLAADLRVTQTVNGSKGIYCMIAKTIVHG